jgi:hypothetical protein
VAIVLGAGDLWQAATEAAAVQTLKGCWMSVSAAKSRVMLARENLDSGRNEVRIAVARANRSALVNAQALVQVEPLLQAIARHRSRRSRSLSECGMRVASITSNRLATQGTKATYVTRLSA